MTNALAENLEQNHQLTGPEAKGKKKKKNTHTHTQYSAWAQRTSMRKK